MVGNAVTGDGLSELSELDGSADAVVSRLCVLHIPVSARAALFSNCSSWMKPGAVLALEDYAAADGPGLTDSAVEILRDEVSVPDGALPTFAEWEATLVDAGFSDVVIEDMTDVW